jgi:hypothetical protein
LVIVSVSQECNKTIKRWTVRSRSKGERCAVMKILGILDFCLKKDDNPWSSRKTLADEDNC